MPTVICLGIGIHRAEILIETRLSSREFKISTQEKNFWKINIPANYFHFKNLFCYYYI